MPYIKERTSNIKERLDRLRETIQKPEFLEGKGLSKEVNIRLFCYDPADEMTVRWFIEQIQTDQSLKCRPVVCNLYEIFLELCDDFASAEEMAEIEEVDGSSFLLGEFQDNFTPRDYVRKMRYDLGKVEDVLLLTGIGTVFPFMQIHSLLETMQGVYDDVPIIVFYPGKFDGRQIQLFGKLEPNPHYRSFNEI